MHVNVFSKHLIQFNTIMCPGWQTDHLVSYEDLQARCVQPEVKLAKLEEENGCIRIKFDLKTSW